MIKCIIFYQQLTVNAQLIVMKVESIKSLIIN